MSEPKSADVAQFKAAMRRFPTGVTVVTSLREGEPRGVTVSSFASVSLEPPMVLICINREARSYLYISTSKIFCVNILAGDQRALAERFSGKRRENQFDGVAYDVDATGAAVLRGTVAHLDCEVVEEHLAGSHSIFIGRVLSSGYRPGSPLGYYNGDFHDFGIRID
ncbi:MAG TPA: flavin reductase family protein [Candidatus Baltobacteraceae bacterium]|nr:flavin reductase family protein [Candidatus Baltobacteraceae bacterium]